MARIFSGLFLAVAVQLVGFSAHAMKYESSQVQVGSDGRLINRLRMSGIIEPGEWQRWTAMTEALDPALDTLFVLDSPGGNVPMGLFLIRKVEEYLSQQAQHQRKTWVLVEHDCSSMCVPLFFTWENRLAISDSRIGLHGVSLGGLAYDNDLTGFYLADMRKRAEVRQDVKSTAWLNEMVKEGEFAGTKLTPHLSQDLATSGSGLIAPENIFHSEEETLREL